MKNFKNLKNRIRVQFAKKLKKQGGVKFSLIALITITFIAY